MNQTTTFSSYSQNFDIHIHYIYYEVAGGNEMTENIVHAIQYQRIMDCLEEKGYIIHREDLIFLLKDDGASFFEDSLRLYDPQEDTYFKVPDDWEFAVDYSQPSFSLLIWIKSINLNLLKRVDEVNENLKSLEERMTKQIESLEAKSKINDAEINKLKFSNQVLFQQLTKISREGAVSDAQAPAIANGSSSSSSNVETRVAKPLPESQLSMNNPDSIDIALMYSEPLVRRDEYRIISLGEPVNFEDECSKVLEILRKKEKRINMYFEIATVRHLVNVLSLSPTVLHIICHGDFNKERNQFFLCFEENGELFELYSGDLKARLQEINFNTQVVFINACHSEGVAKVFIDAGVPCVVAVHSELKIEDTIAQRFSESFYWQLFEGKTIEEAFRHARAAIAGKDVYTCCCAHSHKPGCEWSKLMENEGYEKAHHAHTPTCTDCFNKFGNKFEHKENCLWAVDFLTLVCGHDELPEKQIHACCCSPELPHNEVMKFKLICRDEKFAKQVLWRGREKGTVSIKSTYSSTETKFSTAKITGRNRETYELFSFLTSKETKVVNFYGLDGVGKTTLAKQVGNYLGERGYFREKMSILMLEKTPSITYFRANLFKEITGSYDVKTFCESINSSKMLFILLKCDTLIKDNRDGFRQDLSYIMEYAPNVKFLVVTNNKADLNLGESTVLMKELKKLDAAKLLVKNAYLYLPWDLRNFYNLAQHDIFDLISLTPQGIWALSEKLKNNKSLDEIERELALEKERHKENLPTVEMEETVLQILKGLREQYYDAYYVVICVCLYPSGLAFTDMEELSTKGRITKQWKEILLAFLKKKALSNQYCEQEKKEGGEEEAKFDANSRVMKEITERGGKPIERSDFKPDNYIWLNITKDAVSGEVWFVPTQFIIKVVEKYCGDCFAKQTLKKFEYMAILSTSLINKIKKNYNYCEKLVEFSAVSTFGLWKLPIKGEMCMMKDADLIQYIENKEYDFDKLKQWFGLHENNFFSCFDPDAVQRVISNKNLKEESVIEVMEILCLAIPTLFKIISPRGTGAMEAARRAEQVLIKFNETNVKISLIRIKLSLFLAALHMGAKNDIHENFTLAKIQLKLTQEEIEKIKGHKDAPLLFAVAALGFAYYFHKGFKKNCLNPKEFPNRDAVNKQINNIFKKIETLAIPMMKSDESLKVPKAKIALMKCKIRNRKSGFEKQLLEDMREAVIILTEYKSLRLIMKAHYLYACLKIEYEMFIFLSLSLFHRIEKRKNALKASENSSESIRNMTDRLVEIKNIHLIKTSLDIAQKVKDKKYEAKIKKKIDEINLEIRQRYFNVINIMRAAPIIDLKCVRGEVEAVPIGFPTRLASIFKHEIMDALSESNKVLCMKFSVLTKKELIEAVHSGCRVLQINCTYSEPNCLCVETEFGVVERITFDELRRIFTPKVCCNASKSSASLTEDANFENALRRTTSLPEDTEFQNKLLPKIYACKKVPQASSTDDVDQLTSLPEHAATRFKIRSGEMPVDEEDEELTRESSSGIQHPPVQEGEKLVDVLILGVKYTSLAELFVSLKIPHIITFDFVDVEVNFRHKVYEDECLDMFSLYFYQELISQKSIYDAFETARSKVFDYLGEKFFENKPQTYISQIIGRGPVLLPEGADHSEILFGPGRFPLANGRIEDISSSTYPTNIEKMYIPYTGRRKDFYGIVPKLVQNRGIFELTGVPGIGKTAFALHVGYFILNRDIFTDGVFYIPLKTLRDKSYIGYQMKDLLRDTLGMDVQFGFLSQLKNKNMLLIFDDFDLLYNDEVEYCRLFFRAVKQCKIACLVITQQTTSESQRSQRYTNFNYERQQEISNEILDKEFKWDLQGIIERDLLLLLQAFIKPQDDSHSISLEEIKTIDIIKQCEGNPRKLLDALLGGKIKLGEKVLEINPLYKEALEFEQHYTTGLELLPMPSVHYSHYASNISSISGTSDFRYSRSLSKHEPELFHHPSSISSGGSFRRDSIRGIGAGGKSSDDSSSDYHKAKSFRMDNTNSSNYSDLSLNKNMSSIASSTGYPQMKRIDHRHNEKKKNLLLSNIEYEDEDSMMKSRDSFYVGDTERHSDQEIFGLKRVESKDVDTSKLKERKGSNFTKSHGEESLVEEERESSGEEDFNKENEDLQAKENDWDIKSGSNLENKIMRSQISRRLGRPRVTTIERKKGIFKPQKYRSIINNEQKQ